MQHDERGSLLECPGVAIVLRDSDNHPAVDVVQGSLPDIQRLPYGLLRCAESEKRQGLAVDDIFLAAAGRLAGHKELPQHLLLLSHPAPERGEIPPGYERYAVESEESVSGDHHGHLHPVRRASAPHADMIPYRIPRQLERGSHPADEGTLFKTLPQQGIFVHNRLGQTAHNKDIAAVPSRLHSRNVSQLAADTYG